MTGGFELSTTSPLIERRNSGRRRVLRQPQWGEVLMAIYIVEKVIEGVMLVDVRGRITLGPETEALRSKLKQLIDGGQQRIILDLGEVTYIDSVGLSTLVASYTSARRAGGDLKLLRLPRGVHQLLQITRLSTVFEIYESLDAARQAFAQKQP
jgi:anti-sigma B factor antagonist